jgi:hypothetical protein
VCAGSPPNGVLAEWDPLTGATDSAARMAERVAEDRRALGLEKARALREYRTQPPALEAAGRVTRPEVSRWEVGWDVTAPSR